MTAFGEFARVVRGGGWLLVAFHVDSPEFAAGQVSRLTTWFGERVEIDGYSSTRATCWARCRQRGSRSWPRSSDVDVPLVVLEQGRVHPVGVRPLREHADQIVTLPCADAHHVQRLARALLQ